MKETIYCNKCGKPMWVDDKTSTAVLDLCNCAQLGKKDNRGITYEVGEWKLKNDNWKYCPHCGKELK